MYFVLYDRHLNSIGETYILEDWSRIQRAVDFDETRISGEQIPYSADPFCVVINDRQGKQVFSGLASTPSTDEKTRKTTILLKDYMTLMNSDIVVDWGKLPKDLTLGNYINHMLTLWLKQVDVGFVDIKWDVQRIQNLYWDSSIPLGEGNESVQVYDLVHDCMSYYGLYCLPLLDVYHKTLTFVFYPTAVVKRSIRLKDFGIESIDKSYGDFNRVTVYDYKYNEVQRWAITENNAVVSLPSKEPLVYPAKSHNVIAETPEDDLPYEQTLWDATYDAVMSLSQNRYQVNIDLDVQKYASILDLSMLDFSYTISVYTDEGLYQDLPVGEIEQDSKGTHIIRLGYRIQELTQEI